MNDTRFSPVRCRNKTRRKLAAILFSAAALAGFTVTLQAGLTYLPNRSFESPPVPPVSPYASPELDYWQKAPQPAWYDPTNFFNTPWEYNMGAFTNVPFPGTYIDNCDGNQAAFVFALPGAGLFQDYNTIYGTNATPSHAFNAKFNAGRSYNLTVGVIGGGGGMSNGATLQLSLYYRDASNNMVTVAAATVTNTTDQFPTNTHFVDFQVHVPTVNATDPWAGLNIGVNLSSTVSSNLMGGYWDLDNVRLVEGIDVPNYSFESPVVPPVAPYAEPDMDYWEKTPQPGWYDPTNFFNTPWEYNMGTFTNVPFPGSYIDNCDGNQAAFVFGLPGAGIFQDYNSVSGTNVTPSHALNAKFTPGKAYNLTVGVIGGGGGMSNGATMQLSLYYRDASNNMVTVAATTVTNNTNLFPTTTHFVDCSTHIAGVKASDPWANQNIGIEIVSTVGFDLMGGYWDVDNVRLTETVAPALVNPGVTNGQMNFTLRSEPELQFEILSTTNVNQALSNWISIKLIDNGTGATPFHDMAPLSTRRFYIAHQKDSTGPL